MAITCCTKNGDVCTPNAAPGTASGCNEGLICCQSSGSPICTTAEACAGSGNDNGSQCVPFSENLGTRLNTDAVPVGGALEYDVEVTCKTPTDVCFYDERDDDTGLVQDFSDPSKMVFQLFDSSADSLDGMIARGQICGNTFSWEEDPGSIPLDRVEVGRWIFHDEKHFSYESTVYDSHCTLLYKCIGNGLLDSEGNAEDPPSCDEVHFSADFDFPFELPAACQSPGSPACGELDIGGNWFESYVCSSTRGQCCERLDNDNYTLNQSCQQITSPNNFTTFSGTLSGNTMAWEGHQGDTGASTDYNETGTYTFSDTDNFTGTSAYQFIGGGGGQCVSNGRKGALPEPVPWPAFCNNLSVCGQ